MAVFNGNFKGSIGGKNIYDYKTKFDYENLGSLEYRINIVNKLFNIVDEVAQDKFMIEVWDTGICKSVLNKSDILWSDTNVASTIESAGTYLLAENRNGLTVENRRSKEVCGIDENRSTCEDDEMFKNDSNYRLAPPEAIFKSDYSIREVYSKDYNYYKDVLFKKMLSNYEKKIGKDSKSRYGFDDKDYQYVKPILKDEYTWNKIRNKELVRIKNLELKKHDVDILKFQMKKMKECGTLYYRDKKLDIPTYENEKNVIKLSKQLKRFGVGDYRKIEEIENKTFTRSSRSGALILRHITENLGCLKDDMITIKLNCNNRVMINPPKNGSSIDISDMVDLCNKKHINALVRMPIMTIAPTSNLSFISYDIQEMIGKLYKKGKLSDRDLYILEGLRHNITEEDMSIELEITQQAVNLQTKRIINTITKGFMEDEEDLLYINVLKGEYKKCSKCGEVKLLQRFDKNGSRGLMSMCKECR